jgi:hypothetical protein
MFFPLLQPPTDREIAVFETACWNSSLVVEDFTPFQFKALVSVKRARADGYLTEELNQKEQ